MKMTLKKVTTEARLLCVKIEDVLSAKNVLNATPPDAKDANGSTRCAPPVATPSLLSAKDAKSMFAAVNVPRIVKAAQRLCANRSTK